MPDKFLRELVTILLSTFSHGVHIGTSCQVDAELDQSVRDTSLLSLSADVSRSTGSSLFATRISR